jgi:dipeptidyl aminopeptidase/acylaminoacyl peptidase
VLIAHGTADAAVSMQEGRAYESAFGQARLVQFHTIPNADHIFSEPESEQRLIQQTKTFLLEHL